MLLNMFTVNRYSIFRCVLTQYTQRNKISSTSSSFELGSTMKKLIDSKQYGKALDLFDQQSKISSDFSINMALKACTKLNDYQRGINIQRKISLKSLENPFIQTSLIHFYMQCHDVDNAIRLFSTINNKSNSIYAAMFKGLISNKMPEKVFDLLDDMIVEPNGITLSVIFSACTQLSNARAIRIGKKLIEKMPIECQNNYIVLTSVLSMLLKFGDVKSAEDVFRQITKKDIITYNAMMKGYVGNKLFEKVLDLFEQMSLHPNDVTFIIVSNACAQLSNDRAIRIGKKLLEQMPNDCQNNNIVLTSVLDMLMKFGDVKNAQDVYRQITKKDIVTYNAMMKGYVDNKLFEKALDLFEQMPLAPNKPTFTIIFSACSQLSNDRAKEIGKKLFKQMSKDRQNNNIILTSMLNMLMKFGDVKSAEDVFRQITKKDIITYNAMMKGYVENKMFEKALDLFEQIPLNPNEHTFTIVFNICSQLSNDRAKEIGRKLLEQMPKHCQNNNIVVTSVVDMLMKFGDIKSAEDVFGLIIKKHIVTYNAMMKGYVENKMFEKALDLFEEMPLHPDEVTFTIVFNVCAHLSNDRAKEIGKKLLKHMPKNCRNSNNSMNSTIDMLMKFGDVKSAEDLFELVETKDIVTYGAMMKGYVDNKMYEKALDLFEEMPLHPDESTFTIVFNACAHLSNDRAKELGKKLLEHMPKDRQTSDNVLSSVMNMFIKFSDVKSAEDIFRQITKKNIVTYGAMMKGYNLNNEPEKSFEVFREMKQQGIVPDEIISTVLISACAQIGIRSRCESIVDQIPLHLQNNRRLQNAIIHMWGKVGSFKKAQQIFKLIDNPDVITYNSMINGFGLNGMGFEAVDLYRQMPKSLHDEVTYICVLNACSHSGLLHEAGSIFNEISTKTEKIITAMIDCLSRLFMFDKAQELMNDYEKSNRPCLPMYMAIMSGLRNQHRSVLSEKLYNRMKYLFRNEKEALTSGSILLSNIYSSLGDYERAADIRLNRIKEIGRKVKPGLSWTEVNGELVRFEAHDTSHPRSAEIYARLKGLLPVMIQNGYRSDSSWITRPIRENETVESVLCGHSEKLAIGYNLIQQPVPSFIQVTKNLRVCGDCHEATKLIAKIEGCEIIVRDANRIHHFFPNGQCSCQDHF